MIDLHTHSLFSDGELLPSELAMRLEAMNYSCFAITDHIDSSNVDFVIPRIIRATEDFNRKLTVKVIPGVEITHVHPELIQALVKKSRKLGARIIIVHGETIVEPVAKGTNREALLSDIDILAHPGLISIDDAKLAAEKGVYLEISARKGHSLTNGHVACLANKFGANLLLNSDAHSPQDLMSRTFAQAVAEGTGLGKNTFEKLLANSRDLANKTISNT